MPTLGESFDADRGDLIYGLESDRQEAIYRFPELLEASKKGSWFMINSFNNNTILRDDVSKFHTDPKDKTPIEQQKSAIMGKVPGDKKQQAATFVDGLYKRYPPSSIAQLPKDKLKGEGGGGDDRVARRNKMIRASCKFGIENLVREAPNGVIVHFLLGGLSAEKAAVREEFDGKVPITFSEIRSVFRNWNAYQARIRFYDADFERTDQAPWDEKPVEWRAYAIRRLDKIVKQAEKAKLNTAAKRLKEAQAMLKEVRKVGDKTPLMDIVDTATNLSSKSVTFAK